jgi:hypothetical protein
MRSSGPSSTKTPSGASGIPAPTGSRCQRRFKIPHFRRCKIPHFRWNKNPHSGTIEYPVEDECSTRRIISCSKISLVNRNKQQARLTSVHSPERPASIARIVRNYLVRPPTPGTRIKPGNLDPYKPYILKGLKSYPRLSRARLFEEIREQRYSGGATILRDYLCWQHASPLHPPPARSARHWSRPELRSFAGCLLWRIGGAALQRVDPLAHASQRG